MIGLYGGTSGPRGGGARLAVTYNGLTLNNPSDTLVGASGPDTYELNTAVGSTSLDYLSEVNQQRDGLEVYPFRKVSRIETVRGVVRAPSQAKLHDKIKALANAFDPAKIAHDNDPTGANPNNMFLAFDFSVPTLDTANYATGLVPSRYYALPFRIPDPVIDNSTGFAAFFDLIMLMRDPRRYWQTLTTQAGAATIDNSLADYMSWPTLAITMTGAGSATYSVTNTTTLHGALALVLDLSNCLNGDVVTVDFERSKITRTRSGVVTDRPSYYVSGDYFHMDPVASNAIAYANTTNTSSSLSFRRAWSI